MGVSDKKLMPFLSSGAGVEQLFSNRFGLTAGAFFNHFLSDYFDGSKAGEFNDNFWGFEVGLKVYF